MISKEDIFYLIEKKKHYRKILIVFMILVIVFLESFCITNINLMMFYILTVFLIAVTFQKLYQVVTLNVLLALIRQLCVIWFQGKIFMVSLFIMDFFTFLIIGYIVSIVMRQFISERENIIDLTYALAKSLDSRDRYTAFHSANVAHYSLLIAKEMKLKPSQIRNIYIGALLHDIGKIGIPENILTKNSRLTDEEYKIIQQHSVIGYKTLEHIASLQKGHILDIVLYHHERFDGQGYPNHLSGEEIPLEARIVGVADAFDAMTSNRVYRKANSLHFTVEELKKGSGKQFDPNVVHNFLNVIEREGNILQWDRREEIYIYH